MFVVISFYRLFNFLLYVFMFFLKPIFIVGGGAVLLMQ